MGIKNLKKFSLPQKIKNETRKKMFFEININVTHWACASHAWPRPLSQGVPLGTNILRFSVNDGVIFL
jgi:hypothetical protein